MKHWRTIQTLDEIKDDPFIWAKVTRHTPVDGCANVFESSVLEFRKEHGDWKDKLLICLEESPEGSVMHVNSNGEDNMFEQMWIKAVDGDWYLVDYDAEY